MTQEAANLTRALKGDAKVQGDWGEMQLEQILERSGLQKGIHFETQASYKQGDEEGGGQLRPDVVVHLPNQRHLVIDAKVPLRAYERYSSAETAEERKQALAEHLQATRNHIKGLHLKHYEGITGINTLDYVFLFIPIEPAFLLALKEDPDIFKEAYEKNLIPVSPSTLIVNLRTINNLWRIDSQNKNAQIIAEEAGKLHDKFVGFLNSLEEIGKNLDRAQRAYEGAHKQLSSGSGNLVGKAGALKKLGAKTKKSLPESLLELGQEDLS